MKKFNHKISLILALAVLLMMSGCDHDVTIGTTVYEDGSLDRTVMLYEADSDNVADNSDILSRNFMGVSEAAGWKTLVEPVTKTEQNDKDKKYNLTFTKHFASVEDANNAMNGKADTIFHIMSTFEKRNRWFYTYIEYSDTYRSLDRFSAVPKDNYFTKEDYEFIDRLGPEGKPIAKADSLFLARLNEKIFDIYGSRTIFDELYNDMLKTMKEYGVASSWSDSLLRRKEEFYQVFVKDGSMDDLLQREDEKGNLLALVNHLKIPIPEAAREVIRRKSHEMDRRLSFVSDAYSAKYRHSITMPWTVVASNADSVKNNQLFWNPPVIKVLLKDYTMTARARKMNVWAVVLSAAVILLTLALFLFRGRSRP
jgi:hypothetical protein